MSSDFLPGGKSKHLSLADAAEIPGEGKSTRVLFSTSAGRMVLIGLSARHEWREHATPNHVVVQVISGECEFQLENRTEPLATGDMLYLRPDLAHSVKALEATVLLLNLFRTDEPQPI